MSKIFKSVKIQGCSKWESENLDWWVENYVDKTQPHIVCLHLHGKKEKRHLHVVCIPKKGANHLTLDMTGDPAKRHTLRHRATDDSGGHAAWPGARPDIFLREQSSAFR